MTEEHNSTEQEMSQRLSALYSANFERIFALQQSNMPVEGPYLIHPSDTYSNAPIKLAICGQQTQGWVTSDNIEEQMLVHLSFDSGANYLEEELHFINSRVNSCSHSKWKTTEQFSSTSTNMIMRQARHRLR